MPKKVCLTESQIKELKAFSQTKETTKKEAQRVQAILMLNKKISADFIIDLLGLKRSTIFALKSRYIKKGIAGIQEKRKKKPRALLTKNQRNQIAEILHTKSPREFGFESDYWTTTILAHCIYEQYGIKYRSKTSLYLIFKESRLTFHKPGKVYEKRDDAQVKLWADRVRPIIEAAWNDSATEIFAADEMILSSVTTFQKIWLPAGQYPKIEVTSKRKNISFYGFLNIKSAQEHAFLAERQNMYISADILSQLRAKYPTKKILLFWDNAGWHKGSVVMEFLQKDGNIEVINFPPYSPEENPQEKVWKSARKNISHNLFINDLSKVSHQFSDFLNTTFFPYSLLGFKSNLKM